MSLVKGYPDRGYVLINALLLVAALSALAVQSLQESTTRRGEVSDARTGAELALMADAGVAFAVELIRRDLDRAPYDDESEAWALKNRRVEVGRGTVEVTVRDVQARLNLNLMRRVSNDQGTEMLTRLTQSLALDATTPDALSVYFAALAEAEGDAGNQVTGTQAADDDDISDWFVAGDFTHVLDAAMLPGITPEAMAGMLPHVAALPQNSGVNVNTADRATLSAVTGLPPEAVDKILEQRARVPFAEMAEFESAVQEYADDTPDVQVPDGFLSVSTAWFDVRTVTRLDGMSVVHLTRLYRDADSGEAARYYQQRIEP